MPPKQQILLQKYSSWLEKTFSGSGNPEVHDAWEACVEPSCNAEFGDKLQNLKTVFLSIRTRIEQLDPSWSYQRKAMTQDAPHVQPNETVELYLNPWQLSFDPALSLKGKSKMVNVLRCAMDFLERPYNSMENPIHVILKTPPGSSIADFSVGHGIGFAKSTAIKLILLATVALELTDQEMLERMAQLKACFHIRCTYKTQGSARADRFQVLQDKFGESARPRPDPVQISQMLVAQAMEEGLQWSVSAQALIEEFNGGSQNEDRKLSDLEVIIVQMYPNLDSDTQKLIEYHWQMHKVKQSALPYVVLSADVLQSGTKPKKGMESELWSAILAPDSRKKHWYIMRKIHFFLCRLADAKRLRKKINLANQAHQCRPGDDATMAWCMACIFSHYLATWQTMMSQSAVNALVERYGRGYLDVELQEKARAMNPNLTAKDFRFLIDVGVKA